MRYEKFQHRLASAKTEKRKIRKAVNYGSTMESALGLSGIQAETREVEVDEASIHPIEEACAKATVNPGKCRLLSKIIMQDEVLRPVTTRDLLFPPLIGLGDG